MAKLYDDIFKEDGHGDITLKLGPQGSNDVRKLKCHSLVLRTIPYFANMLQDSPVQLIEQKSQVIRIEEDSELFLEVLRFIYTAKLLITDQNVGFLLNTADKYCIDEISDKAIHWVAFEHFSANAFYDFIPTTWCLQTSYKDKLRDKLMESLQIRYHLCLVTMDPRWQELPLEFIERVLSLDNIPVNSEVEVLGMAQAWCKGKNRSKKEIVQVLKHVRVGQGETPWVITRSEFQPILDLIRLDGTLPRVEWPMPALNDPPFVIHTHDDTPVAQDDGYTIGPRDFLQQDPGWIGPCSTRLRVLVHASAWSHRERCVETRSRGTIPRSGGQKIAERSTTLPLERAPAVTGAGASHAMVERSGKWAPAAHSDPAFVLGSRSAITAMRWDRNVDSDASSQDGDRLLGRRAMSPSSKDTPEMNVVHAFVIGVNCGGAKHGVRVSQPNANAIYLIEYFGNAKKNVVSLGGSTVEVNFEVLFTISEANASGISKCRLSVLSASGYLLMEHVLDASSITPAHFYCSPSQLDAASFFSVNLKWLEPVKALRTHDLSAHSQGKGVH